MKLISGGGGSSLASNGTTSSLSEFLSLTHAGDNTNALIQFNSTATTGVMFGATGTSVGLKVDATNWLLTSNNTAGQLQVPSTGIIGWSSTTSYAGNSSDTILTRRAAATLQFGAADAASPIAQTLAFQGPRGGTDSNVAGQRAVIQASLGTGSALPVGHRFTAGAFTGAGSTLHTAVDRLVTYHTTANLITNNSALAVARVAVPSNTWTGVVLGYHVEISDGTDFQNEVGMVSFCSNAKGAAITHATPAKFGNTQLLTAGTLTVTFTAVTNGSAADYKVTSNSSLTPTTHRVNVWIHHVSGTGTNTLTLV